MRQSTRRSIRGSEGGPGTSDPGCYSFGSASLLEFILLAYDAQPFQILSKIPLDRDHFDLLATLPAGATKEQFRAMLQTCSPSDFISSCTPSRDSFLATNW
ncbi:MAG TPA: TIGR03435 family protein, partial [Bryobacteraceae bacterium]|nr:TIGR03435 family protein [Bryobacteraceae bacterium]